LGHLQDIGRATGGANRGYGRRPGTGRYCLTDKKILTRYRRFEKIGFRRRDPPPRWRAHPALSLINPESSMMPSRRLFAAIAVAMLGGPLVAATVASPARTQPIQLAQAPSSAKLIARIWHGHTPAAKAEEYTKYLYEAGIKKIESIPGNRGAQMLRKIDDRYGDFTVISYWDSIDAIKRFAGENYEETHNLPKDAEYLLDMEPKVKHLEVLVNDWAK
jgi:heme-degrading monooxygenase HmoA